MKKYHPYILPNTMVPTDKSVVDEIKSSTQNRNQDPPRETPPAVPSEKSQKPIPLRNAMVGREYDNELDCSGEIEGIRVVGVGITDLSEIGLQYHLDERRLKGCPTQSGDFSLWVKYRPTPSDGARTQKFTLLVNHDPKDLWKNLPPDDTEFSKENDAHQGKIGQAPWMLAAASKRGRSHAHMGKHRDDDFCLIADDTNGWRILAVSDGAGSAKFSRKGAEIAVECASNTLAEEISKLGSQFDEAILNWQRDRTDERKKMLDLLLYKAFSLAVYGPVSEIAKLAKEREQSYRDFYATLLLCAHKTIGGEQFVAGYWIGDGALAVYAEGEYTQLLGESDGGEYAGQTRFLDFNAVKRSKDSEEKAPIEEIMQRIRFDSRPEISAVFLMTDGVSDPKFDTDANLKNQKMWDEFWKEIKPQLDKDPEKTSKSFLDWLGFWSPGNHDDRTLAVLYPASAVTGATSAGTVENAPKEEISHTEDSGDE